MGGGLTSRCTLSPLLKSWPVKVFFVPRETAVHVTFGFFFTVGKMCQERRRLSGSGRREAGGGRGSDRSPPTVQVDGVDERRV